LGEISEALERARQEEVRQREERRKRRVSEVAESIRHAAVESAIREDEHGQALPEAEAGPVASEGSTARVVEVHGKEQPPQIADLHPVAPSLVNASNERIEQCRHLANRVAGDLERRGCRTVAVVSSLRMEGKSTVSSSLAFATASLSQGRTVALVDLDLRRPTIATKLGFPFEAGIEAVLEGKARLEDVCVSVRQPAVDIYPARPASVPAHELLVLPEFAQLVDQLAEKYRVVVFDTPPTLLVPDASLILKRVETCIPVARSGFSRARMMRQMFELLPRDRVIGTILNATSIPKLSGENYSYYRSEPEPEVAP
jgi:Mrp family chromosome partitioning ATPase